MWRNSGCKLGVIILACVAVHSSISHTYTIHHESKVVVGALNSADWPTHTERSGFNTVLLIGASELESPLVRPAQYRACKESLKSVIFESI